MSTMYIDAVCCDRPSSVVCQSVTLVSPAKMAEPIEMPFGLRTRLAQGTLYYMGLQIPPWEVAILRGEGASHYSVVICAKTAEPIEMPFGL